MANVNIRNWVVRQIKPMIPRAWVLIPSGPAPETISKPTVILTLTKIQPNPANPIGGRLIDYVLTLLEPTVNPAAASANLDDKLVDLLSAIEGNKDLVWTSCERGAVGNNLGWDISLSVNINKN